MYKALAEDILSILNHERIPQAVICGYSMGGTVVFEFMRLHHSRLLGSVILSGFAKVDNWRLKAEMYLAVRATCIPAIRLLALVLSAANADSLRALRLMWQHGRKARPKFVRALFEEGRAYDCTLFLSSMQKPVCLIYGARDGRLQKHARMLHNLLPNNELHILPNGTHQLPMKQHEAITNIVSRFGQTIQPDNDRPTD